jgi:hypothetical protein
LKRHNEIEKINSLRDVALIRLDKQNILVVSCDSSGAIGPKRMDALRVNAATVGKFVSRVALMETVAVGAKPICLSISLCMEPEPVGQLVMKGAFEELNIPELERVRVIQSSEKNFKVKQTGVGASVIGIARSKELRIGRCQRRDLIFAIGYPCVGLEVFSGMRNNLIADLRDVYTLTKMRGIHELLPVGSKGIWREAEIMAADSNHHFQPVRSIQIDARKSAGPSTVVLCAIPPKYAPRIREKVHKPVTLIGEIS